MLTKVRISLDVLLNAYELMHTANAMAVLYEQNKDVTSKYVHATSRGHEAIQIALGLQLLPFFSGVAKETILNVVIQDSAFHDIDDNDRLREIRNHLIDKLLIPLQV